MLRALTVTSAAVGFLAFGGPQDSAPSFEVASIRPLKASGGAFHFTILPNRLDVKNMNLRFLIKRAYDLRDDQVSGPDWLVSRHYDILATAGTPVSQATMLRMLQNLLTERFQLATHWETRNVAIYRLVVLPKGPKLKIADRGYAIPNSPTLDGGALQLSGPMSMPQLAESLTRYAGKPVVDETSLDGFFNFSLTFASTDVSATDAEFSPSLLTTAVQEQLGLKLVPEKGPVKTLVIDHAEPVPTSN